MKKITISMMALVCSIASFSKDLFVEPLGLAPAYSTISAAITAAEDGDNIYIDNGVSNNPFNEDLTIDKSIKLFNITEGEFFVIEGNVTLDFTQGDIDVTIHGMKNNIGSLSTTGGTTNQRSEVTITDCFFDSGSISLSAQNLVANIIGCDIDGSVTIRHGNIIGNSIRSGSVSSVSIPGLISFETINDTVRIIGNNAYNDGALSTIYLTSNAVNYVVSNNIITNQYSSSIGTAYAIRMTASNSSGFVNQIINNTIKVFEFGILLQASTPALVSNNLLDCLYTSNSCLRGIRFTSADNTNTNVTYNVLESGQFTGVIGASLIANNSEVTPIITSTVATPTNVIDLGNPSPIYYDLDLTVGDPGAFGGSFSYDQFFPLFEGKSKVFFVDAPRVIREGDPIFIQAEAYDR